MRAQRSGVGVERSLLIGGFPRSMGHRWGYGIRQEAGVVDLAGDHDVRVDVGRGREVALSGPLADLGPADARPVPQADPAIPDRFWRFAAKASPRGARKSLHPSRKPHE